MSGRSGMNIQNGELLDYEDSSGVKTPITGIISNE